MRVYLIGFMGSGKSTWGKKLATKLCYQFIDLDKEVEKIYNKSIKEIFDVEGEEYFRSIETETLRELDKKTNKVVASGGGTPCFNNNMKFMNDSGITIYLKLSPLALASRLSNEQNIRPLIGAIDNNEIASFISKSLKEREQYYKQAKYTVEGLNFDIAKLTSLLKSH